MTDLELELRDLGAHLDIPPARPVLGVVAARLVRRRRRRRRTVVLAVAIATVAIAVAFAVPGSRASLLRFFHVRGAAVSVVDRLPRLTTHRPLGEPIPLDTAPFRLLLPDGRRPEKVYAGDGGGYWLRYPGLLLFEFESDAGIDILKKATLGMTDVEYVQVDGAPGIWIGGRHALYLPGGPPRAAGRTLIWQRGRLTLRLEAAVGRDRALAIARSVR
jgi:hypothetical protein